MNQVRGKPQTNVLSAGNTLFIFSRTNGSVTDGSIRIRMGLSIFHQHFTYANNNRQFIDILAREATNADSIYLYLEADGWCAYEQSACRLDQLLENCEVQKIVSQLYEVIVVRIVLDEELMNGSERNRSDVNNPLSCFLHRLRLRKEGYLEIPISHQPEILFNHWKEELLKRTQREQMWQGE